MRRVYVEPDRLTEAPEGTALTLDGDEHHHLARVLRVRAGDALVLFDGVGGERDATVVTVGARATEVTVGPARQVPGPVASVTLLQALPRGEKMDLVVQKTTELGVARIVPVLAGRSVPRLDAETAEIKRERWEKIAREAARQCGRADVPVVDAPRALEDACASVQPPTLKLALWEGLPHERPLRLALAEGPRAVALLIGPEGGLEAAEVAVAERHGFVAAGLGPRILRTETAAIVAVALAQAAAGGLD